MKRLKQKAFTIIELIIVIVVIGILFVTFISRADNVNDKAKITGVQTDFRSFYTALKAVGLENQLYTLTEAEFERLLNENLDKQLQFTLGVSNEKDPWGEHYVYVTHRDIINQQFYVMFACKGGRDVISMSSGDVVNADADDMKVFFTVKQVNTGFQDFEAEGDDLGTVEALRKEAYFATKVLDVLPEKRADNSLIDVSTYSWDELKAISKAVRLGYAELSDYGIDIDAMTKAQLTKDGFTLVDAGLEKWDYQGFTFMGQIGHGTLGGGSSNKGGYNNKAIKNSMESFYRGNQYLGVTLDQSIRDVIKAVDIVANTGLEDRNEGVYNCYIRNVHIFIPSLSEVTGAGVPYTNASYEGSTFDYYKGGKGYGGNHAPIQSYLAWTRTANAVTTGHFMMIGQNGSTFSDYAGYGEHILATFVI